MLTLHTNPDLDSSEGEVTELSVARLEHDADEMPAPSLADQRAARRHRRGLARDIREGAA